MTAARPPVEETMLLFYIYNILKKVFSLMKNVMLGYHQVISNNVFSLLKYISGKITQLKYFNALNASALHPDL